MNKKIIWLGLVTVLLIVMGWSISMYRNREWNNPLGEMKTKPRPEWKRVVGFLPTWMVGKTRNYGEEITDLVFLGIEVSENGSLVWDSQSKKISSQSYLDLKKRAGDNGVKNIVGIKLFNDDAIDLLLDNESAREKLLEEVAAVVIAGDFDGVNVDFEYQGDPVAVLDDKFLRLLTELKSKNLGEVGVDVFVNTINKGSVERINKLFTVCDYVLVMAYDFHGAGSKIAGPVAPLRAPDGKRSIWEMAQRVNLLGLDKNKIVVALPLYGYEWQTESEEVGAEVVKGDYQMASLKRSAEMEKSGEWQVDWDELSFSPRMVKTESSGLTYQVYYENIKSLTEKARIINNFEFGGIGFWALGYEGESDEWWKKLWQLD